MRGARGLNEDSSETTVSRRYVTNKVGTGGGGSGGLRIVS